MQKTTKMPMQPARSPGFEPRSELPVFSDFTARPLVGLCKTDKEKSHDDTAKAVLTSDETNVSLSSLANSYLENVSSAEFNCKNNREKSYDVISSGIFTTDNNISLTDLADTFLKNASPRYNCENNSEISWHNTSKNVLQLDETISLATFTNDFLANISLSTVNCKNVQEKSLDVIPEDMLNSEGEVDVSLADLANSLLENVSCELSHGSVLSREGTSGIISDLKVTENEIDKFLKDLESFDSNDGLEKITSVENEKECDYFCTRKEKSETELSPECFETESRDGQCIPEVNLNDCIKKQDSSVYDSELDIYSETKLSISGCFEAERKSVEYSPEVNLDHCVKKEDSASHYINKAHKPNGIITNTLSACKYIDFVLPKGRALGYKLVEPLAQSNESPIRKQKSSQKNDVQKKQSLFAKALSCKTKKNSSSLEKIKYIKMELKTNHIRPFMLSAEDKLPIESRTVDRSDDCVLSFTGRFVLGNEFSCQIQ